METSQQKIKREKLQNRKARIQQIRLDLQMQIQNSNLSAIKALNCQQEKIDNIRETADESPTSNLKIQGMKSFLEKYELQEKLGEGSHGVVWKSLHKIKQKIYAVKIMQIDEEHIMQLHRNFKTIKKLQHENVIQYNSIYIQKQKNKCSLVMEYLPSMKNLLEVNIQSEKQLKNICYQIMEGVSYIHSKSICHRDIKPQNILYSKETGQIKLIDFGISRKFYDKSMRKVMLTCTGTLPYKAPEMLLGGTYDERIDVWAIGILIYKLITNTTPFQDEYVSKTIENIIKCEPYFEPEIWSKYSKFLKDLVYRLLKQKNQRISLQNAMSHFWFTQNSELQLRVQDQCKSLIEKQNFYTLRRSPRFNKGTSYYQYDNKQYDDLDDAFSKLSGLKNNHSDINGKKIDEIEVDDLNGRWINQLGSSDIIQSDNQEESLKTSSTSCNQCKI